MEPLHISRTLHIFYNTGVSRWWRDVSEDEHLWHALCARLKFGTSWAAWPEYEHTFAVALRPVDSSDARYARVHAACPAKAVYMRHCITMKWCSGEMVVRTRESGE